MPTAFEDKDLPTEGFKFLISLKCPRAISLMSDTRWIIKIIIPLLTTLRILKSRDCLNFPYIVHDLYVLYTWLFN